MLGTVVAGNVGNNDTLHHWLTDLRDVIIDTCKSAGVRNRGIYTTQADLGKISHTTADAQARDCVPAARPCAIHRTRGVPTCLLRLRNIAEGRDDHSKKQQCGRDGSPTTPHLVTTTNGLIARRHPVCACDDGGV